MKARLRERSTRLGFGRSGAQLLFDLSRQDAERLYESGFEAATEFFRTETRYVDQYGQTAPGPADMARED